MLWAYISLIGIQIFFALFIVFLCIAFLTGGPYVPSRKSSVASMIRLAGIRKGSRVIDVGSGDGRVLFAAADSGAIASGYEINPFLVWYTNVLAFMRGKSGYVHASWKDLWKAQFSDADIIFVYLIPWKMADLEKKLRKEAKRGTLVISNSFVFPKWKMIGSDPEHHVYAYRL